MEQLTAGPTETDFEARIHGVLTRMFPWFQDGNLKHQLSFALQFGGAEVMVKDTPRKRVQGRLDILVTYHDKPLAILELKREGTTLSQEDADQAISYARMLRQMAPLAILTNGETTKIFKSFDGAEIEANDWDEAKFKQVMTNVAKVAQDDLKRAIQTLLGGDNQLWVEAVRASTSATIADLEGTWAQNERPFVRDLHFPRKASAFARLVLEKEAGGKRIVFISGAPLVGKSSVLKELAQSDWISPNLAVLFVELGSLAQGGIFRRLAEVVSENLGWPADEDEIRHWVRGLSQRKGEPTLVIALDGLTPTMQSVVQDLVELASNTYGDKIRVIASIDDSSVKSLKISPSGRQENVIGRRSITIEVEPLDDDEFSSARHVLLEKFITFAKGAELAAEYRQPWIIRAIGASIFGKSGPPQSTRGALLPPLLGLSMLDMANDRFAELSDYEEEIGLVAECIVREYGAPSRERRLVLPALRSFLLDKRHVRKVLGHDGYCRLEERGLARTIDFEGLFLCDPRPQEYLAFMVAQVMGKKLATEIAKSHEQAGQWLIHMCSLLPFGDILGAKAIINAAADLGGISLAFFETLLADTPRREPLPPGTKAFMYIHEVGTVLIHVLSDGAIEATAPGGKPTRLDISEEDVPKAISGGQGLLILSHLGSQGMLAVTAQGTVDAGKFLINLMLRIATTPMPLRRPSGDFEKDRHHVHEVPGQGEVLCHCDGMLEPITLSLMACLLRAGRESEEWIRAATQSNSFALISRLAAALAQAAEIQSDASDYFKEMKSSVIEPALERFFPGHGVGASCP
jgi:hypothetical protein